MNIGVSELGLDQSILITYLADLPEKNAFILDKLEITIPDPSRLLLSRNFKEPVLG